MQIPSKKDEIHRQLKKVDSHMKAVLVTRRFRVLKMPSRCGKAEKISRLRAHAVHVSFAVVEKLMTYLMRHIMIRT
jgi:hypothetical protein